MQYTENYRLNKPEYKEDADVGKLNENADIIDKTLSTLSGRGLVYDGELHAVELGEGSGATGGGGSAPYVLTAATRTRLGGIKIGEGLEAEEDGETKVTPISSMELRRILEALDNE